ncbi:MAG: lipoyl(octanoyl) transferase, partial [Alphaproteobacteria bacterium]|nr:lipoyl(octanoyl) transferase [Alphaproteobacteria bacterium]
MNPIKKLFHQDWGLMDYKTAWDKQEFFLNINSQLKLENRDKAHSLPSKEINNYLFFVEHPPVITIGRNGLEKNNLIPPQQLEKLGVSYFQTNRGGDITVHSPGQLVVYPILDLEQFKPDLGWYVRSLEEVIILTLKEFGIE